MPFNVQISFDGPDFRYLSRRIFDVAERLTDFSEPLQAMQDDFYTEYMPARFDAEGGFQGESGWAALSPAYAAWKQAHYGELPILYLTGRLRRAFTSPDAEGAIASVSAFDMVVGVNIPVGGWNLAGLHQFGTTRMPARPPLRLSQERRANWAGLLRRWITAQFAAETAAGFGRLIPGAKAAEAEYRRGIAGD